MINIMKIDGQTALIQFDTEIEKFRGEFIGLNGGADFYADNVQDLKREGAISLHFYLETCQKKGVEPYKSYSGKISARLTPERHALLEQIAAAQGESINHLLNEGADLVIRQYG